MPLTQDNMLFFTLFLSMYNNISQVWRLFIQLIPRFAYDPWNWRRSSLSYAWSFADNLISIFKMPRNSRLTMACQKPTSLQTQYALSASVFVIIFTRARLVLFSRSLWYNQHRVNGHRWPMPHVMHTGQNWVFNTRSTPHKIRSFTITNLTESSSAPTGVCTR